MRRAAALVALVALATGCRGDGWGTRSPSPSPAGRLTIDAGTRRVFAEIADDPAERQQGLMYRRSLDADAAMLFVFPRTVGGGFWMKNTLIPLSIAFLVSQPDGYRVVAILDMQPCAEDPCQHYTPDAAYDAALETNVGWFDRAGVRVEDVLVPRGARPTAAA